ncbi:putative Ig domain-containing protein [Hyalangium sp.]|uniref:putative Ig domain-containing protein n=1 Tax=Hyalangium sp. TaxID=2028555 RepID=UPI002D4BB70E|nr:putative Ig domain-containing protein [Hyalangium sp.]HYI02241.1 putative Ig domain-containing protein [Hyalangium sp.]
MPTLADTPLAETTVGVSYAASVSASGGTAPYTFSTQGLPPGIVIASDSGALSGSASTAADFHVQVTVKDAHDKEASKTFPLKVYPGVSFKNGAIPSSTAEFPYSTTVELEGGKAPLTLRLASGELPAGVSFNANARQLAGTFPAAGTFTLSFEATDVHGSKATQHYSLTVAAPLRITLSALPAGKVAEPYSELITTSGGRSPITASLESGMLPLGLAFSGDRLSGTPHAAGHFTFVIKATDANDATATLSAAMDIAVSPPPQITSTALTTATEGVDYRRSEASPESLQTQASQGTLTFAATGLPPGLSLNASTGELGGTPAQGSAGSYPVNFTVTDAGNQSSSKVLTLQVVTPQPITFGGVVGLAPSGSRITDTLTVFASSGRLPLANVGVRVRKNGQEYAPAREALTNAEGKVVFTGLGLNGTTDTVDITANGKDLTNTTFAGLNAAVVTLRMSATPLPLPRVSSSGAYDPSSRRFLLTGGQSARTALLSASCLNDMVEAVDVAQKDFTTRVPGGLPTSPAPRVEEAMAIAGGAAVLFGGRKCIGTVDSLGDTWEFDLASNTWAAITPTGNKPTPRRAQAMVRDASGNFIYMVGGFRTPFLSNEVWRYEPASNTWLQQPAAPFSRAYMASTLQTVTGELWLCGGRGPLITSECQAFNPTSGSWSVKPSLPSARTEFSMAFDPFTETLYAFGGRGSSTLPYGDLLVLRQNASAWESVTPLGATPSPRYGHVMYFDLTRRELVVALGMTGMTLSSGSTAYTRLGDVWTYDGQAWTERGPSATPPGYSVSGQITGGPVSGTAQLSLNTPSGFVTSASVALDPQGHGTYALPGIPPGEPLLVTVLGQDFTLAYPNSLWTYAEAQRPGLAADATLDIHLPPGPAVLLQATGSIQVPPNWYGNVYYADPQLEVPGFPATPNGVSHFDMETRQFSLAFAATAAPNQQRISSFSESVLTCARHGIFNVIGSGNLTVPLSAPVTGMAPGQAECIPQGPRGVSAPRSRVSAPRAKHVSVGDLDGDNFPDLLIPLPSSSSLGLVWGSPSAGLASEDFSCCDVNDTHSVATGDFNKDGKLDLAVTEPATSSVKVLLADASAQRTFGPATAYPVGPSPSGIAAADVNGDGFQDLLVANQGASTVSLLYGATHGTFTPGSLVTLAGTSPTQVLVTQVDGDTALDLVVLVAEGVSVALDGSAQGPFGNSTLVTAGAQPSAVVVGQLNGDAFPDLAVANAGSNNLSLLLGADGGTFAQPVNLAVDAAPAGLVLAELTGDTHLDLAVTSPTEGTVTLLQGASSSTFTLHSKVSVAGDPRGLAAADFNGDGLNDLAVASPTANGVYLLLGQKPAPTAPGTSFSFNAPAHAGFMLSVHALEGQRVYWNYYAPLQPGPVSYSLPLPSTLAPSAAPVAPPSGQLELSWSPQVRQWEPSSARPFNPRQFSLNHPGADADTQPGYRHYFWP